MLRPIGQRGYLLTTDATCLEEVFGQKQFQFAINILRREMRFRGRFVRAEKFRSRWKMQSAIWRCSKRCFVLQNRGAGRDRNRPSAGAKRWRFERSYS